RQFRVYVTDAQRGQSTTQTGQSGSQHVAQVNIAVSRSTQVFNADFIVLDGWAQTTGTAAQKALHGPQHKPHQHHSQDKHAGTRQGFSKSTPHEGRRVHVKAVTAAQAGVTH